MNLAGKFVLAATDALGMQAQGAMWIYDHLLEDWRYYLVTSLVDSLGRQETYQLLLEAFETTQLPASMTVEDVHLGSPADPFFQSVNSANGFDGLVSRVENCNFHGVLFDGVIYRFVEGSPSPNEARKIERLFVERVKGLVSTET